MPFTSEAEEWLAGERVSATALQTLGSDITTYTPSLTASTTNPTLGTGSVQSGVYSRQGGWVEGDALVQFGTAGTAAGSGQYRLSLPVAVLAIGTAPRCFGVGFAANFGVQDYVTTLYYPGGGVQYVVFVIDGVTGGITHNTPFAWGTTDVLAMHFRYPGNF